jgi:hypothetical protein
LCPTGVVDIWVKPLVFGLRFFHPSSVSSRNSKRRWGGGEVVGGGGVPMDSFVLTREVVVVASLVRNEGQLFWQRLQTILSTVTISIEGGWGEVSYSMQLSLIKGLTAWWEDSSNRVAATQLIATGG